MEAKNSKKINANNAESVKIEAIKKAELTSIKKSINEKAQNIKSAFDAEFKTPKGALKSLVGLAKNDVTEAKTLLAYFGIVKGVKDEIKAGAKMIENLYKFAYIETCTDSNGVEYTAKIPCTASGRQKAITINYLIQIYKDTEKSVLNRKHLVKRYKELKCAYLHKDSTDGNNTEFYHGKIESLQTMIARNKVAKYSTTIVTKYEPNNEPKETK